MPTREAHRPGWGLCDAVRVSEPGEMGRDRIVAGTGTVDGNRGRLRKLDPVLHGMLIIIIYVYPYYICV